MDGAGRAACLAVKVTVVSMAYSIFGIYSRRQMRILSTTPADGLRTSLHSLLVRGVVGVDSWALTVGRWVKASQEIVRVVTMAALVLGMLASAAAAVSVVDKVVATAAAAVSVVDKVVATAAATVTVVAMAAAAAVEVAVVVV